MVVKIIRRIMSKICRLLCRHRGHAIVESIVSEISAITRDLENTNWDMTQNGEMRVLKCVDYLQPKCVFDVGANVGEWSKLFATFYPKCQIHAFEIVPSTFDLLVKNTESNPNIIVNNFGLSDIEGSVVMNFSDHDSTTATACNLESMEFHDNYYDNSIECVVRRGVDYLEQNNINNIDFLKIDVEGMDLKVIKGFDEKLKFIKVIQFEYGIFNISSHDLLFDFFKTLEEAGFLIGKIYPSYVKFFKYHFKYEDFGGCNYLAVSAKEKELIKLLSCS